MSDLVKMALDVAKGCELLEANKFIHRDIGENMKLMKPSEIIIIRKYYTVFFSGEELLTDD